MKDKEFLWWIHERLIVYGDDEFCDFMHHLRSVIRGISHNKESKRTCESGCEIDKMRKKLGLERRK